MAITIPSCCSKLALPPSPSTTHQLTRLKNEKWRRQYMIGMACVIIGLQMNDSSHNIGMAMAIENHSTVENSKSRQQRWSDKRICPSWNLNSLETIVPENLPRPSARRRWESVGRTKNIPVPPPSTGISVKVNTMNNCFTM